MLSYFYDFWLSLKYAWQGINVAIKKEKNFTRMIVIALGTIVLGLLVHLSLEEWIIIGGLIGFVLSLEMLNTASERLLNLVTPELSSRVQYIKDILAGGVLIAALTSLFIGLLIFIPKLF